MSICLNIYLFGEAKINLNVHLFDVRYLIKAFAYLLRQYLI